MSNPPGTSYVTTLSSSATPNGGAAGPDMLPVKQTGNPQVGADNWQDPVRDAIVTYSSVACISPEILQHVILGNVIDRGSVQTLIDRDLLELLPQSRKAVTRTVDIIRLRGRPETHMLPGGQTMPTFSHCTRKAGLHALGSSYPASGPELQGVSPSETRWHCGTPRWRNHRW